MSIHDWWIDDELQIVREPRLSADIARIYFRRMPTADAEGSIESKGGVGNVSMKRLGGNVFRYLQIVTGPRCSPSTCAEMPKKDHAWQF